MSWRETPAAMQKRLATLNASSTDPLAGAAQFRGIGAVAAMESVRVAANNCRLVTFLVYTGEGFDMDHQEEEAVIRRAQAGDRNAFALLVERDWPHVHGWLQGMLNRSHAAED